MDKNVLLALIKGLTTYIGGSQFNKGEPAIVGENLETLIAYIKNND